MEDKIILTLEEVANWSYDCIMKQRKVSKRLSFAVFCLSIAGYLTGKMVMDNKARITELENQVKLLQQNTENPASE